MFLFVIEVEPKPNTPQGDEYGGAFVRCWVDFKMEDGAELLARHYLHQDGWLVRHVDAVFQVEHLQLTDDPEDLRYFSEAQNWGICLVYHTWPVGTED